MKHRAFFSTSFTNRFSGAMLSGALLASTLLAVPPTWAATNAEPDASAATEKKSGEKAETDAPPPGPTQREIELGKKAEDELKKDPKFKLLDGSKDDTAKALLEKLNQMATELGKVSARPKIKYVVKVIDDDDLNAFTLPNGSLYMYRGLLDAAGSDDEIAAVLSHEIAHNARMHALRGQAKARKLSWVGLAALAAMLAGGRSGGDIAQMSQYLLVGIMNGYSVDYEKEADESAIEQMAQTKWNPSALVSFMERLSLEEKRRPEWEPGIFRTHPPSDERRAAAITKIKAMGLPFTPRDVTGAKRAVMEVAEKKDRVQVKFGDAVLLELAVPDGKLKVAQTRGEAIATQINTLFRANLKMHEISTQPDGNGAQLLARGVEVARITPDDARLQNLSPLECAQKWRDNFRRLFWTESIKGAL